MRTAIALLVFGLLSWLPVLPAQAHTISLTLADVDGLVIDGYYGPNADSLFATALPYADTLTITGDLGGTLEAAVDLTNDAFDASFDFSVVGEVDSKTHAFVFIDFSVDEDVHYDASGVFSVVDSEGRHVAFGASLLDSDESAYLFDSAQESFSTPNEAFVLGLSGGDTQNKDIGSLTGTLIAGHAYHLTFAAQLDAVPTTSTGATASGSISFGLSPVPEPATGALLALGLVTVTAVRRRTATGG